jgi:hypothetical protein
MKEMFTKLGEIYDAVKQFSRVINSVNQGSDNEPNLAG